MTFPVVADFIEEERGEMSPSYNHSFLSYRIAKAIDQDEQFNIHIELTIEINGHDYVPDIAVYEQRGIDFLHDTIKTQEMPMLIVEILSPTQSVREVTEKIALFLEAGVKSCWLVLPEVKTITVFHDIRQPVSYSIGNLVDDRLGVEISVAEIFK
jgi:Uma2 family endonuclease